MATDDTSVAQLCARLQLSPHPEGGFYREHFRGARVGAHSTSTAIYYLMPPNGISTWHRVRHDELWHHYQGGLVELHTISEHEGYRVHLLGSVSLTDADSAVLPCHVVPAGVWQAARALDAYALFGNTVSPGFEFSDWQLLDVPLRTALTAAYPDAALALDQLSARQLSR